MLQRIVVYPNFGYYALWVHGPDAARVIFEEFNADVQPVGIKNPFIYARDGASAEYLASVVGGISVDMLYDALPEQVNAVLLSRIQQEILPPISRPKSEVIRHYDKGVAQRQSDDLNGMLLNLINAGRPVEVLRDICRKGANPRDAFYLGGWPSATEKVDNFALYALKYHSLEAAAMLADEFSAELAPEKVNPFAYAINARDARFLVDKGVQVKPEYTADKKMRPAVIAFLNEKLRLEQEAKEKAEKNIRRCFLQRLLLFPSRWKKSCKLRK